MFELFSGVKMIEIIINFILYSYFEGTKKPNEHKHGDVTYNQTGSS